MEEKNLERKENEVEEQQCDLVQVEKGLEDTTRVLFEDFSKRRIDVTMTVTGLQLVRDAREAGAGGDPEACKRLELISRFLARIRPKESAK